MMRDLSASVGVVASSTLCDVSAQLRSSSAVGAIQHRPLMQECSACGVERFVPRSSVDKHSDSSEWRVESLRAHSNTIRNGGKFYTVI